MFLPGMKMLVAEQSRSQARETSRERGWSRSHFNKMFDNPYTGHKRLFSRSFLIFGPILTLSKFSFTLVLVQQQKMTRHWCSGACVSPLMLCSLTPLRRVNRYQQIAWEIWETPRGKLSEMFRRIRSVFVVSVRDGLESGAVILKSLAGRQFLWVRCLQSVLISIFNYPCFLYLHLSKLLIFIFSSILEVILYVVKITQNQPWLNSLKKDQQHVLSVNLSCDN